MCIPHSFHDGLSTFGCSKARQQKAPPKRGLFHYRPLAPFLTAPGSVREPVLFTPAEVGAPELLASPAVEGMVPGWDMPEFMPVVPDLFGAIVPGPTFPSLEAPGAGCV